MREKRANIAKRMFYVSKQGPEPRGIDMGFYMVIIWRQTTFLLRITA